MDDKKEETQESEKPEEKEEPEKKEIPETKTSKIDSEKIPSIIPETVSMLEKAESIRKGMEDANKKHEELTKRDEAVAARRMLAGRAEAGLPDKTSEEEEAEKTKAEIKEALDRYQ